MMLLPYPEKPNFICYHNKAFPFGIIQANSPEDITKWLCTKCINTVYNPNSPKNKFDLAISDAWGNWEGITTQQVFNIKFDLLALINLDLINVFRTFIGNGCYVYGTYNEKYVPVKWAYNIEDYVHDFLVIGYDEENFHSVGFIADGRFKHFKIPNQNFIEAVCKTGSSKINIKFFSYNNGIVPQPNIDRMLSDLEKYISTVNYSDNPTPSAVSYGISSLMRVREFFEGEVVNNERVYIDRRYSRVLYEHEWVFSRVIEIFLDSDEKSEYLHFANNNLERAKHIHMLGLKMEMTGDNSLIHRITGSIDKIIEDEKRYIPQLILLLKEKHENGII